MARAKKLPEALQLLKDDHEKVSELFEQFRASDDVETQTSLCEQICNELTVHTEMEERAFYPAAREAVEDEDALDEAAVEHRSVKALISEIRSGSSEDPLFRANLKVLEEYVKHHVSEEENQIFPMLVDSDIDFDELAQDLRTTKQELLGGEGAEEEPAPRRSRQAASGTRREHAHGARRRPSKNR